MARKSRKSGSNGLWIIIGIIVLIAIIIVLLPVIFIGSLFAVWYFGKKNPNPKMRNIAIGTAVISLLSWSFIGDSNDKNNQDTSVKSGIVSTTATKKKENPEVTTTEKKTTVTEATTSTTTTTTEKTTTTSTIATTLEAPTTQAPDPVVSTTESVPVQNFATAPVAEAAPAPQPVAPEPEAAPVQAYYANCTAVRNAGAAPIYSGDPGYGPHLDRDGDGVACE